MAVAALAVVDERVLTVSRDFLSGVLFFELVPEELCEDRPGCLT